MKGLIQVCIDSATQIVTILHQLATCDLLGKPTSLAVINLQD